MAEEDGQAAVWSQERDDFSWLVAMWLSRGKVRRPRVRTSRWDDRATSDAAQRKFRILLAAVYLVILFLAMIVPLVFFRG